MNTRLSTRPMREVMHRILQKRLLREGLSRTDGPLQLLDEALAAAGVAHVAALKVRPGTRGIHLVEHPRHGRCVLKITDPRRHPDPGLAAEGPSETELANQCRATMIRERAAAIFPAVYEIGDFWTLEEFIHGIAFRQWMETRFRPGPVADFFHALRKWSLDVPAGSRPSRLPEWQVREISRHYIVKCLRHSRYSPWKCSVSSFRKLINPALPLRHRIDELDRAAETVSLSAGLMCGDMGNINLLVGEPQDRIYNIDYEYLGRGHWGFDGAYLISSIAKLPHPVEALRDMRGCFFRELEEEGAEVAGFFGLLTEVLTEISRTIYGHNWK